ncbi:hypothetical protein BJY01DRAFT_242914 [Aspergillus pseudoustus]|uniref:Protein kinase domain-containing protein n=1 Tax=Aspergillus pseudoustus TaxID=1810923 RepID=A0ABR4KUN3_9EURO
MQMQTRGLVFIAYFPYLAQLPSQPVNKLAKVGLRECILLSNPKRFHQLTADNLPKRLLIAATFGSVVISVHFLPQHDTIRKPCNVGWTLVQSWHQMFVNAIHDAQSKRNHRNRYFFVSYISISNPVEMHIKSNTRHQHPLCPLMPYRILGSQYKGPTLEPRFILARELSAALSQFHTVNWIHKSFRSNNIVFFQDTQWKDMTPPLHHPDLFGRDYTRPESGFSSRVDEKDDIEEKIYRHPEQWGLPTSSFSRLHDIYSLGVVLLEIGFWKPAISLHRWGFKNLGVGSEVKDYLIATARHQSLRAAMGERYQNLVLSCLQSSFEDCDPATGTVAVEIFKNEVIDALDGIIRGFFQ